VDIYTRLSAKSQTANSAIKCGRSQYNAAINRIYEYYRTLYECV